MRTGGSPVNSPSRAAAPKSAWAADAFPSRACSHAEAPSRRPATRSCGRGPRSMEGPLARSRLNHALGLDTASRSKRSTSCVSGHAICSRKRWSFAGLKAAGLRSSVTSQPGTGSIHSSRSVNSSNNSAARSSKGAALSASARGGGSKSAAVMGKPSARISSWIALTFPFSTFSQTAHAAIRRSNPAPVKAAMPRKTVRSFVHGVNRQSGPVLQLQSPHTGKLFGVVADQC